jgi:hypothetical protein
MPVRGAHRIVAPALLAVLLVCSCSGNPPRISRVSAQLLYEKDLVSGRIDEELALFVVPEDKDGLDDLEYLHVISDRAELYWSLDSSAWTRAKGQSDEWIGSARLAMPPNERFPRGSFRVLLYDLAGDSDEQTFTLPPEAPEISTLPFPQATVAGGRITASGPSEWLTLLVYTTSDRFVKSFPAQARGVDLETIRRTDSALRGGFRFWVYTYWAREAVGLMAGPYAAE